MLSHLKISQKKQSVDLPLPPGVGMGSKAFERKRSVDILPESICPNQMSRRRKSVDVFWPLEPGPAAKSIQEQKTEADVMPPQATGSQELGSPKEMLGNSVEIFYTPDFGSPNIKGQRKKSVEIFLKADAGRPTDEEITSSLKHLNEAKKEINSKVEKQRRKAQKSLIKIEQKEATLLLIDRQTEELQILKKRNETEKTKIISAIQSYKKSLDNMVSEHSEQEKELEQKILLDKDKLEDLVRVVARRQESMDDGDASYINNEEDTITLMSISKCDNLSLSEVPESDANSSYKFGPENDDYVDLDKMKM